VFNLSCNHRSWLHVKQNTKIILKLFQYFQYYISNVTTSETAIKLFQPLKEFYNYFKIT